jgi:hypothetical protein
MKQIIHDISIACNKPIKVYSLGGRITVETKEKFEVSLSFGVSPPKKQQPKRWNYLPVVKA